MAYKVTVDEAIRLNESDSVTSILQNVSLILRTRKGTVPLYREFGVDFDYLDRPMSAAAPIYYARIKEAIEEYEPRVEVIDISFEIDKTTPGILRPTVEVNIISE